MTAAPTLEQIAAGYGVKPTDVSCSGYGSAPDKPRTSAQKLADRIKSSGAGQQRR